MMICIINNGAKKTIKLITKKKKSKDYVIVQILSNLVGFSAE